MAIGVTGFEDPAEEAPWAMPIAFVLNKNAPPTTTALLEAAAMATVSLLASEQAATDPEWAAAIKRWCDGRIRKVVRRGSEAHFLRAEHLPGLTVEHRGAKVRAFLPGPTDQLPRDLSRMQVSGSALAEVGEPAPDAFLTVAINPELAQLMSAGKSAAQVAHAAQLVWMRASEADREAWRLAGFSTRVIYPAALEWAELSPRARQRVVDAGFTEIPPGSNTTIALYEPVRA